MQSVNACIYFFLMMNEISNFKLKGGLFKLKTESNYFFIIIKYY